jgi:hypothetical protein
VINMTANPNSPAFPGKSAAGWIFPALAVVGLASFVWILMSRDPARAWQAYLINFLLWSGIAQGAVLFSAVMHMTKARWSGRLAGLAESFAGFFPVSFLLFLLLLFGRNHVFPWLHEDLHGKELWLNVPFLMTRDGLGLLILYALGFIYLYYALQLRLKAEGSRSGLRGMVYRARRRNGGNDDFIRQRMTVWGGLYILAFALVLCLIGFDLVMAADPHWISTLFGGYTFVKAFYTGLGALIILASIFQMRMGEASGLTGEQFIDVGKLFLAFCLVWADFFYVQLVVIWYGNIPEETHYVILRTVQEPWRTLTFVVFALAFVLPFLVLINRRVKTRPVFMIALCSIVIIGIWLEHLLLLGPALSHGTQTLPLGFSDVLIFLGFLGLMAASVGQFMRIFPETSAAAEPN